MTSVMVKGHALRLVDDAFPRWIEVSVTDVDGHDHRIIDKVPVLTDLDLRAHSAYPVELWLEATLLQRQTDCILVRLTHAETTEGLTELWIRPEPVEPL